MDEWMSMSVPAGPADGPEHEEVAVGDDGERDEEHEAAEHQGVALIGGCRCDVVPGAGGQQTLRDVGTCRRTGRVIIQSTKSLPLSAL